MKKKVQAKKSSKMVSFQLFRDKNAKDWKESLREMSNFFKKNRQWILIFLFGLVTFPVLFFLSVSLKEATAGLMHKMTALRLIMKSSNSSTSIPVKRPMVTPVLTRKPVVIPTPSVSTLDTDSNVDRKVIGGDKDEHNCLISAGYSWCESKNKCLREWEEDCPE